MGKTTIENLGEFNSLPKYRIYDMYARDLLKHVRDGEQLSVLYSGRSMTVVAFMLPVTDTFTDAVVESGASTLQIPISNLKERDILKFLREQSRDEVPLVITVTLSSTPVVYIVRYNSHWRSVVASVMGLDEQ